MSSIYRIAAGVCLVGVLFLPRVEGALIEYSSRGTWSANATLNSAFATNGVSWIDFDTPAECGQLISGVACPVSGTTKFYGGSSASSTAVNTMSFASFSGLSMQARGAASGSNYYWLTLINDTATYPYPVAFVTTRQADIYSGVTLRINLPTGTTAFAFDLATGCQAGGSGACSGIVNNVAGTITVKTGVTGSSTPVNTTTVTTSGVAGALTFFGATSDAAIDWIELTPSSPGTVVATRLSYGALGGTPPAELPESKTSLLVGAALIALRFLRRRAS